MKKIAAIGAGSWGTTLANLLAKKGYKVTLWAYEEDVTESINTHGVNELYLPGTQLSKNLSASSNLEEVVTGAELVLLIAPSQVLRYVLKQVEDKISSDTYIVCASKGIENDTLALMSEVINETLTGSEDRVAFLSGPSFAKEVASETPTAVTVASTSASTAELVQSVFSTEYFRVYTGDDVVGVEIGAAIKNVIALAAGVSDGLGFGYNTRAALINRGLMEMARLGIAVGGKEKTFFGLAGMGDLVLTCTGDLSRNRNVGFQLGQGKSLEEIIGGMQMVAEGVKTTLSAHQLANKVGVDMPIVEQMYQILYEKKDPSRAVKELMGREVKREH